MILLFLFLIDLFQTLNKNLTPITNTDVSNPFQESSVNYYIKNMQLLENENNYS